MAWSKPLCALHKVAVEDRFKGGSMCQGELRLRRCTCDLSRALLAMRSDCDGINDRY